MAPRKHKDSATPSAAAWRRPKESRKVNNASQKESKKASNGKTEQPTKFGLQHFFGRLSQSSQSTQVADPVVVESVQKETEQKSPSESNDSRSNPVSTSINAEQSRNSAGDEDSRSSIGEETPKDKIVSRSNKASECDRLESSDKSPSLTMPDKILRFSPSMMIKQTQDDGGEEITYTKTPIMERLQSLKEKKAAKTEPVVLRSCNHSEEHAMNTVLRNASIVNCTPAEHCTEEKNLSGKAAIYEQLFSSPTIKGCAQRSHIPPKLANSYKSNNDKENILTFRNGKKAIESRRKDLLKEKRTKGQRKDLLELLNTAEDVLRVEKPLVKRQCLQSGHDMAKMKSLTCEAKVKNIFKSEQPENNDPSIPVDTTVSLPVEVLDQVVEGHSDEETNILVLNASSNAYSSLQKIHYLVLEVSDFECSVSQSHTMSACKILRLLNEQSGSEKIVHLHGEWAYSEVKAGDMVNVIGEFDAEEKCVIDDDYNLLIVNPDILVSGSRVASSFSCLRRAVLDERIKSADVSIAALMGTMLHQVFQAALVQEFPTKQSLEEEVRLVMLRHIDSLYATGGDEKEVHEKLTTAIPILLNWIDVFKGKSLTVPSIDFGPKSVEKQLTISEVVDIEEMVWSPKYGLKGMFDASIRVKLDSGGSPLDTLMMPLEFKTGRGTSGQAAIDHRAQVILYNLLMSDRYFQDIGPGLIYYLHTDKTQGVAVQRADLVGLIMQRNQYASSLLNASTTQSLPSIIKSYNICQGCRHLESCMIYHKAQEQGNMESSGLGEKFDNLVSHLNDAAYHFLRHWDRLIDLEAEDSQTACSEIWRNESTIREQEGSCLSFMVLDPSHDYPKLNSYGSDLYVYKFHRQSCVGQKRSYIELENGNGQTTMLTHLSGNLMECAFKCGDHVILSTEDGRIAVASGVVKDVSYSSVTLSLNHRLRLGGMAENEISKLVWRIDKDETSSTFAVMRLNLLQLFVKSNCDDHCRRLIVDLQPPRFDSGAILSQDPAVSYVRAIKDINDDQCRAIYKILSAKDYALILGMPGTGKTTTMVHAVKALLERGASILLTSYTNSAVDNLLLKLKTQGVDFLRLGRSGAIHPDIQHNTIKGMGITSVKELQAKVEQACVVGVTCLGITHPLLSKKKFDICIVDEAGQITLPVCLGPLMYAKTFVLVGDHYQLPPLVRSAEAREKGMGISLFRRLSEAHPQAVSALQCQYRMCAGVMKLSNALIYGDRLRCGSTAVAEARLDIVGLAEINPPWLHQTLDPTKALVFIDTDSLPAPESRSHNAINNSLEAFILLKIVKELVKRGVNGNDIGVISPYNSQVDLIRRGAAEIHLPTLEVNTIDKYQGRDKDCILVSFVRSSSHIKDLGPSLLADWHRINVAITRAKKKLIMIGSQKTLSMTPLLRLMIQEIREENGILTLSKDTLSSPWLKGCTGQ